MGQPTAIQCSASGNRTPPYDSSMQTVPRIIFATEGGNMDFNNKDDKDNFANFYKTNKCINYIYFLLFSSHTPSPLGIMGFIGVRFTASRKRTKTVG